MITDLYIGVDEVGAGALAGKLMVCGVVPGPDFLGCGDSKKYSRHQREELYPQLIGSAHDYLLMYADAEAIDRLGIWNAWGLVVRDLVQELRRRNGNLPVLVDGTRVPPVDACIVVKGGDRSDRVIGAASVIAKVTRDREMIEEAKRHPGYDWEKNVGYHSKKHVEALQSLGPTPLHRRSFIHNFVQV